MSDKAKRKNGAADLAATPQIDPNGRSTQRSPPTDQPSILKGSQAQLPLCLRDVTLNNPTVRNKPLLHDVSLRITTAGITTVVGPNGAGKSLTMRLLAGLMRPTTGSITWDGIQHDQIASQSITLVLQSPVLLRRSVAANIDYARHLAQHRNPADRLELLALAQLTDQANQPARSLSLGEQQRLALARALALSPDILLVDEPTASLDPASTMHIENILQTISAAGTKIILVTHDLSQARRLACDIAFMANGRCVEHTEAIEFLSGPTSREAQAYVSGKPVG
ncbi:MAG: ATP-binding cassette domain-containing protein [Pseudomonadota bacterium]